MVVGALVAGYGAALFFGVPAGFSQPLATFLAGAGALSAGVLAYLNGERARDLSRGQHEADTKRELQRHEADSRRAEVSTLRERYSAIAAQIGHESAAIRQAGVYALTALADDWHAFGEDDERQVCIDLLQWYLRVPFPESDDPNEPNLPEREIRQTIVGILIRRRRRPASDPKSWEKAVISLEHASLPGCVLGGLDFVGLDLIGANLKSAYLVNAKLSSVDLRDANLTDAKLSYANMTKAVLKDADLTKASLFHAVLNDAILTDAILLNADLGDAKLIRADLSGAYLHGADLTDMDRTDAITDRYTVWRDKTRQETEDPVDPLAV